MNSDNNSALGTIFNYGAKTGLSVLVLFALLASVRVIPLIGKWALTSGGLRVRAREAPATMVERDEAGPRFPRFPGSSGGMPHEVVMNGVRFVSQDSTVTACADDVLDFYKSAMSVRGWSDCTEAVYGLSPDLRDPSGGKNSLQDPQYLELYRKITDSNVVMQKDDWSFHVRTAPSREGRGKLEVRICAAGTPSIKDFYAELAQKFAANDFRGDGGVLLDAVETGSGNEFHTRWSRVGRAPDLAFNDMMQDLVADEWRPLSVSVPQLEGKADHCALLVKETGYAFLRVAPSPDGAGSAAIITEVAEAPGW